MNIRIHRPVFILVSLLILLTATVAIISIFWPRYEDRFFEIGLFGEEKTADNYFINSNSLIEINSQLNWYTYIHNHMGKPQEVVIKVKLLNSTMDLPNDQNHIASSMPPIISIPFSLEIDETLIHPFFWSISKTILQNDSFSIKSLTINNQLIQVDVLGSSKSNFCLVFELWVYDQNSSEYTFGWNTGEKLSSASVYMFFKISLPLVV